MGNKRIRCGRRGLHFAAYTALGHRETIARRKEIERDEWSKTYYSGGMARRTLAEGFAPEGFTADLPRRTNFRPMRLWWVETQVLARACGCFHRVCQERVHPLIDLVWPGGVH
jgi:hypothetical protein